MKRRAAHRPVIRRVRVAYPEDRRDVGIFVGVTLNMV
jgi:hypothetical protein